jgi:hypothetical protein
MKNSARRLGSLLIPLICAGFVLVIWSQVVAAPAATVSGTVMDVGVPVAGARVRVRATENMTLTNSAGEFTLTDLTAGEGVEVTAWEAGYYIASTIVTPTATGISLTLRPYHTSDHPDYEWISPLVGSSEKACGNCHPMIVSQWANNAHGGAISNARFFSLYNGTNMSGTVNVEPGYQIDFPGTTGNCASCHAPSAGVDGYLTTDMNAVRGVITAGVSCDFCHKVGGAHLDPVSGSVYPNAPGTLSLRVLRPPDGDNIFFGPYDDIPDPDTYLPLTQQSQFCAACHQFSFWGTPIYESYTEWLASPYADQGVTCQDCHMPPTGDEYYALPEVGGLPHSPESIPSHLQLGAMNEDLLQNTVSMTVDIQEAGGQMMVTVAITNTQAGHHIPTDHPGRHLILSVQAFDGNGGSLAQLGGAVVPDWGGAQAGLPGKSYAKVLRDAVTGAYPVVSYWKQSFIRSDNRIPALASDISTYTFALPQGTVTGTVEVELLFRRTFQDEMDARDWDVPDIVMEKVSQPFSLTATWRVFCPLIARPPS